MTWDAYLELGEVSHVAPTRASIPDIPMSLNHPSQNLLQLLTYAALNMPFAHQHHCQDRRSGFAAEKPVESTVDLLNNEALGIRSPFTCVLGNDLSTHSADVLQFSTPQHLVEEVCTGCMDDTSLGTEEWRITPCSAAQLSSGAKTEFCLLSEGQF
ncbi:hypothetical protein BX600DRAFT_436044 [Xylariales sp. PMI_506]|nr:hypothetical protein BX600DRAFT_436044 [Xylariales sp. PMI_506]